MAKATFYVWVTLCRNEDADTLVAGLVRRGFAVGPLAASNEMTMPGNVSLLCGLRLDAPHMPDPLPAALMPYNWAMNHVTEVMTEAPIQYHSVVVHHLTGNFMWRGSNIPAPTGPAEPAKPAPEDPKRDTTTTALDRVEKTLG
jgi:hypothetical protein